MNNKFLAGMTCGVLLFTQVGTVAAADIATISTTGNKSSNWIMMTRKFTSSLFQSNSSSVSNSVGIVVNTGGNSASKNTGDGSVTSGSASVGVVIANTGNTNEATDTTCDCVGDSDSDVLIEETGNRSRNSVKSYTNTRVEREQGNRSRLRNEVGVDVDTGNNESDKNTGNGEVASEGTTDVFVEIMNEGDSNVLD